MRLLGQSVGFAASAATLCLWMAFLLFNPLSEDGTTAATFAVVLLMSMLALLGMLAAWKARPYVMLAVFAISFFPMGFYLLGTPSLYRWIGICNTALLPSGLLLLSRRKAAGGGEL